MIRRLTLVALISAGILLVASTPAAAHGGPGGESAPATNYRTRLQIISPRIDGISARVIDAGSRLELTNRTSDEVVILGYQDEPYLRLTDDGVFENARSPSTCLNQDRYARTDLPPEADPEAQPEWRRISSGRTARWHDHRAHWMGGADPPAVAADRDSEHVVIPEWVVPVQVGARKVELRGDLTWVPGPSPLPWHLAAAGLAAAVIALSRTAAWKAVLVAAMSAVAAAAGIDAADAWWASSAPALAKAGALTASVLAQTVALASLVALRRAPREAVMLAGAAATGVALLFGLTNLGWLTRSQLPSALEPAVARGTVALSLGPGAGVLGLVATRFPTLSVAPSSRQAPRTATSTSAPLPASLRRHRRALLGIGGAALALTVAVVVRAPSSDRPGTPENSSAALTVHDDLRRAIASAVGGDTNAAADQFSGQVHGPLHTLAAQATDIDRRAAARLLEAKQAVEADLRSLPDRLASNLLALAPTVRTSLDVTGQPVPARCPEEDP